MRSDLNSHDSETPPMIHTCDTWSKEKIYFYMTHLLPPFEKMENIILKDLLGICGIFKITILKYPNIFFIIFFCN